MEKETVSGNVVVPVVLAGGVGSRLWPLSRESYPKQFAQISGDLSLFQQTLIRLNSSENILMSAPLIFTNNTYRFTVGEQINHLGITPHAIVVEPSSKNTAPSILTACYVAKREHDDPILLVCPSDHVIPDLKSFQDAVNASIEIVNRGEIITFGISPTRAETGYGYLHVRNVEPDKIRKVWKFIEKPAMDVAESMVNSNEYLWNSGIFMFRANTLISAFEEHAPEILHNVKSAISQSEKDLDFLRIDQVAWTELPDISIDYAIMEKVENISAYCYSYDWSDMGDWRSVWLEGIKDKKNILTSGNVVVRDCKNSLLRVESDKQCLVGLGLENIVVIAMPDAVLVTSLEYSQHVKEIPSILDGKELKQGRSLPKDHRPWGWFESLTISDEYQVKKIFVKPGAALSLQSHRFRSEHWVVVDGVASVTIDECKVDLSTGESVYIPLGAKHRLENKGASNLVLIEVQTGSYLGEDDIHRYEDLYKRT